MPDTYNIQRLIPQRPPIVMVSGHVFTDENQTVSTFSVEQDNLFVQNGKLTEPGLIENIAQTAALRAGYKFTTVMEGGGEKEITPPVGFIGAIKKLIIHHLPNVGNELRTEVNVEADIMNVSIITGKVYHGERLMAACEMKIFLQEAVS